MDWKTLLRVILLIIVIMLIFWGFRYSAFNTRPIKACFSTGAKTDCPSFNVHTAHQNQDEAAQLMLKITKKNKQLMDHLREKYLVEYQTMNPDKENRIDIVNGLDSNILIAERVNQLLKKYDKDNIYEISPLNATNQTSYTENKRKLVFCLRNKKPNGDGEHDLHDINTIMFVVIHELAHMMNDRWGHKDEFWKLFKFMLQEAVECKAYTPVDYLRNPIVYCGLKISYNPLYDPTL